MKIKFDYSTLRKVLNQLKIFKTEIISKTIAADCKEYVKISKATSLLILSLSSLNIFTEPLS